MFERILPHLYRRQSRKTGPHQPVNSYLWICQDQAIVIDPAEDFTLDLVAAVTSYPVRHVLVTHLQEENASGVANFPDAAIHVPVGDEYLCEGNEAYRRRITPWPAPWEWETRGNYQGHIAGAANERPILCPTRLASSLIPGQMIHGLRIIGTPGHGKNAVSLLAEIDGRSVAFCGDTLHAGGMLWNWFDSEWDYGIQEGIRALRTSAQVLANQHPMLLCPTHGPLVENPDRDLSLLQDRLTRVLEPVAADPWDAASTRWPAEPTAADGWFRVLPGLYQWRANCGNAAILASTDGTALMIDDGLCQWVDLGERKRRHHNAIESIKHFAGVHRIEIVIPTHYHGDHTENIPDLVAMENARVVSLDVVADPIEHPEHHNLCGSLPWYGTAHDRVRIDQRVADGYRLKWREFELELFHLGGQTFHHAGVAVTIAGQRVIFVGDSVNDTPECAPVFCFNDAEPEHRGTAYALDRLLERQPDVMVCGHGSVIGRPLPLLAATRRNWNIRLEQYRQLSARASLRQFFDPFLGDGEVMACDLGEPPLK